MSDSSKAAARLWVRRSAFIYALGVWTVFSYYLSRYLFREQTDTKDPNPQPQDWQAWFPPGILDYNSQHSNLLGMLMRAEVQNVVGTK